eukprot:GHUV01047822.1.p2 GENE.GHUV01047822.1~~GHUV01047822.1.p2  ORF type:complete len:110 (+),score=2.42 GHUV01047822.1:538-867(+)
MGLLLLKQVRASSTAPCSACTAANAEQAHSLSDVLQHDMCPAFHCLLWWHSSLYLLECGPLVWLLRPQIVDWIREPPSPECLDFWLPTCYTVWLICSPFRIPRRELSMD